MSVDRRLRGGLHATADGVPVDVERMLESVVVRTRRRALVARLAWSGAVALGIALVLIVGPHALDALRTADRRTPAGTETTQPAVFADRLAGTYRADILGGGWRFEQYRLEGTWTIAIRPPGAMHLTPPPDAESSGLTSALVLPSAAATFRTNVFEAFCHDASYGEYRWSLSGTALRLTPVGDACVPRRTLLSSSVWREIP